MTRRPTVADLGLVLGLVVSGSAACTGTDPAPPAVVVGTRGSDADVELVIATCGPRSLEAIVLYPSTADLDELPAAVATVEVSIETTLEPTVVPMPDDVDWGQVAVAGFRFDGRPGVGDLSDIVTTGLDAELVTTADGEQQTLADFADGTGEACGGEG